MISKWTLKINDVEIQKDFQKYAMDNVMNKMPVLIGFQVVFVIINVSNLFRENFVNVHIPAKSFVALLILVAPYILTKKTGKTIFMKWMPFLYVLFQTIAVNFTMFYALSE